MAIYDDLLTKYRKVKERLKEIEEQARNERTLWESAIELFNDRFFVPFKLEAKNKAAVCLAHEPILDLTYTFTDGADSTQVVRDTLMKITKPRGKESFIYLEHNF